MAQRIRAGEAGGAVRRSPPSAGKRAGSGPRSGPNAELGETPTRQLRRKIQAPVAPTFVPGMAVWVADGQESWAKASVVSVSAGSVRIRLPRSGVVRMVAADECLPAEEESHHRRRGPDSPSHSADGGGQSSPASPGAARTLGVEDMTSLNYLHEPGVLENLAIRYSGRRIYTYSGNILIALNPFQSLPDLYRKETMELYMDRPLREVPPHVFAIADAAYRAMARGHASQSILVSGESGAGKTETTKLLMMYLAHMGGRVDGRAVEQQVLESNPLLEAFGNAKTVRNDNSSRFGKFVQMQFDRHGRISGAAIRTYLLERSRIVKVTDPERNYHIFYQMCAGLNGKEREKYKVERATDFRLLNQSRCMKLEGISDLEAFIRTRRAMNIVGLTAQEQDELFSVLAAILHLGNCTFTAGSDGEEAVIGSSASLSSLSLASELLRCDEQGLQDALLRRRITAGGDSYAKGLTPAAAADARDSLAKILYARLFDWLVARINESIGEDASSPASVGVLDIYGFECFPSNSFEQFCINLANERLQQHFNRHVFKAQQREYEEEGIDWRYISFTDNQDVLNLIERKPIGILSLLDEACMLPRSTHSTFSQQLYKAFESNPRFVVPKRSRTGFGINHYAGAVHYETEDFMEKNRDYVVAEHQALLASSGLPLISRLFSHTEGGDAGAAAATKGAGSGAVADGRPGAMVSRVTDGDWGRGSAAISGGELLAPRERGGGGGAGGVGGRVGGGVGAAAHGGVRVAHKFSSIGARFRSQLAELMETLSATTPHYVRCIKPNAGSVAWNFDPAYVLKQLRCGGVLEAVQISCAGYPSRLPFADFMERFELLLRISDAKAAVAKPTPSAKQVRAAPAGGHADDVASRAAVERIMRVAAVPDQQWQVGRTKVFLRAGQLAALDAQVALRQNNAAVRIQSRFKARCQRRSFLVLRAAALVLQRAVRMRRAIWMAARQEMAAVVMQTAVRGLLARRELFRLRRERDEAERRARELEEEQQRARELERAVRKARELEEEQQRAKELEEAERVARDREAMLLAARTKDAERASRDRQVAYGADAELLAPKDAAAKRRRRQPGKEAEHPNDGGNLLAQRADASGKASGAQEAVSPAAEANDARSESATSDSRKRTHESAPPDVEVTQQAASSARPATVRTQMATAGSGRASAAAEERRVYGGESGTPTQRLNRQRHGAAPAMLSLARSGSGGTPLSASAPSPKVAMEEVIAAAAASAAAAAAAAAAAEAAAAALAAATPPPRAVKLSASKGVRMAILEEPMEPGIDEEEEVWCASGGRVGAGAEVVAGEKAEAAGADEVEFRERIRRSVVMETSTSAASSLELVLSQNAVPSVSNKHKVLYNEVRELSEQAQLAEEAARNIRKRIAAAMRGSHESSDSSSGVIVDGVRRPVFDRRHTESEAAEAGSLSGQLHGAFASLSLRSPHLRDVPPPVTAQQPPFSCQLLWSYLPDDVAERSEDEERVHEAASRILLRGIPEYSRPLVRTMLGPTQPDVTRRVGRKANPFRTNRVAVLFDLRRVPMEGDTVVDGFGVVVSAAVYRSRRYSYSQEVSELLLLETGSRFMGCGYGRLLVECIKLQALQSGVVKVATAVTRSTEQFFSDAGLRPWPTNQRRLLKEDLQEYANSFMYAVDIGPRTRSGYQEVYDDMVGTRTAREPSFLLRGQSHSAAIRRRSPYATNGAEAGGASPRLRTCAQEGEGSTYSATVENLQRDLPLNDQPSSERPASAPQPRAPATPPTAAATAARAAAAAVQRAAARIGIPSSAPMGSPLSSSASSYAQHAKVAAAAGAYFSGQSRASTAPSRPALVNATNFMLPAETPPLANLWHYSDGHHTFAQPIQDGATAGNKGDGTSPCGGKAGKKSTGRFAAQGKASPGGNAWRGSLSRDGSCRRSGELCSKMLADATDSPGPPLYSPSKLTGGPSSDSIRRRAV